MNLDEYTAYLSARTGQQVTTDQVISYLLRRKNTLDDDRLNIYIEGGAIVHQADGDGDWKVIGQVSIDTAHMLLIDPANAREVAAEWDRYVAALPSGAPMPPAPTLGGSAVITETGLGDGPYEVQARYIADDRFGLRVAEIRVVFID